MNCVVTAGPTYEPLDEVRTPSHNFSTGRLGTELANYLAARGHKVILLIGETAVYAGVRKVQRVEHFTCDHRRFAGEIAKRCRLKRWMAFFTRRRWRFFLWQGHF